MELRVPEFVFITHIVMLLGTVALFISFLIWILIKGWEESSQQSYPRQCIRLALCFFVGAVSLVCGTGLLIEVVYFLHEAATKY